MRRRAALLTIALCCVSSVRSSSPSDLDADILMRETVATYRAMSSYQDRGRLVQTLKSSPADQDAGEITSEFATFFKRPDKFKFSWTTTDNFGGRPEKEQDAIWSDGANVWVSWSAENNVPANKESFDMAVASATGISHGAAHHIFPLLTDKVDGFRFDMLRKLKIARSEDIQGVECYVVRGYNHENEQQVWIGKKDHLIRKGTDTRPDGSTATFERTDILVDRDIPDAEFAWQKEKSK